jgi:oligopeptide/dipeptide ABC transporter ATP-binding protein
MPQPSAPAVRERAANVIARVDDLRVHFRARAGTVHAVDGVSFDILDGETLGLVGETGCGKTVTARSFLRLLPMPPGIHAGGRITFHPRRSCSTCGGAGCPECDGTGREAVACPACRGTGCARCDQTGAETVDLTEVGERRLRAIRGDRIAMIFQDPGKALNPALTVRDQIAEVFREHRTSDVLELAGVHAGSDPRGVVVRRGAAGHSRLPERLALALPPLRGRRDRVERALDAMIADALAETQIPNPRKVMERYPHELSGGMRQRVMISQALACNPDLLIADEPTTALDVTVQARIIELIRELQERRRTAVLYISHDLSLVRRVCDRVAVMYAGRIAEIGPTARVLADPLHPYTRGLLAAVPSATHRRGALVAIEGTVPELIDPSPACRFAGRCPHTAAVCEQRDTPLVGVGIDRAVACFLHHPPRDVPPDELPHADWVAGQ